MNKSEINYLKSIELLPAQINQAYQEAGKINLPKNYSQINKIVTCGMGGSQLGVDFIKHLFGAQIAVPIIQVRGYDFPEFVDDKTLIILISYSGNTEETISNFQFPISNQFLKSNFQNPRRKYIIITHGGKLAEIADRHKIPAYIFKPVNNPSGQPRMGTGYTIGALLSVLKRLNLINIKDNQITTLFNLQLPITLPHWQAGKFQINSKLIISNLKNKIPVIVASEFLQGVAHIMANQINESAKQLALYYFIPELNHHLLEGLTLPKSNQKNLSFLFLYSKNYHLRNQKRYKITQEVLKKQKINYQQIEFKGDKTNQALRVLIFGSYLSYELSKLNKVNSNQVPWVDYFKKRLS